MKHTIAAVVLSMPLLASAEFYTGNTLAELLAVDAAIVARGNQGTTDQAHQAGRGLGFIVGVHDVYRNRSVCTPAGATVGQMMEITRLYLRAIPHRLHETAETLVEEALSRAFPCKERPPQPQRSL